MTTSRSSATLGKQKAGGFATLYLALAYIVSMPFFLLVADSDSLTNAADKVALFASHHWSTHAMYLITYVIFGVVLAVSSLALHERLKASAPFIMRVATAIGLMWAVVLVASGTVFNAGMAAAVSLNQSDPAQAALLWQAVEPVADGLGGAGGELLGGLWVLLVSIAGLRSDKVAKPLGRLGLVLGIIGLVSVFPPLNEAAYGFGALQIIWFVWMGITMLRASERRERGLVPEAAHS